MSRSVHSVFALSMALAVQSGREAIAHTKDKAQRRSLETITNGLEVSSLALNAHPCLEGQALPPGAYVRRELITPDHPEWDANEARRWGVDIFSPSEPKQAGEVMSAGETPETSSEGSEGPSVGTQGSGEGSSTEGAPGAEDDASGGFSHIKF